MNASTQQKPRFFAVITVRHTSAKRPLGFMRDTKLRPFRTAEDAEMAVLRYHAPKGETQGASINRVVVAGDRDANRVEYLSASEIFKRWQTKVYPYAR